MQKCISTWSFDRKATLEHMAELASQGGWPALELGLSDEGTISLDASSEVITQAHSLIEQCNQRVISLNTHLLAQYHFADPSESAQEAARAIVLSMLDQAVIFGAEQVQVIPAVTGPLPEKAGRVSYEAALLGAYEGLQWASREAEKRNIRMAIRSVADRFILSPLEMRELIDRINSPWVGAALAMNQVAEFADRWTGLMCSENDCSASWLKNGLA